jgi:deazaflavin-dependent oxidoreductase (nitroreductase family)
MNKAAFPDVRWGHERLWVNKLAAAFMSSRLGSWSIRKLVPADRRLLERSRGHYTVLGPTGVPLLLLETIGRKSGEKRTTPLIYMRQNDRLFIVGSNFGSSRHPSWSWNLLANPEASVIIGGAEIPVIATELKDAERAHAFQTFVDYTRAYEEYTGRTDRELRVFALKRRSDSAA